MYVWRETYKLNSNTFELRTYHRFEEQESPNTKLSSGLKPVYPVKVIILDVSTYQNRSRTVMLLKSRLLLAGEMGWPGIVIEKADDIKMGQDQAGKATRLK